MYPAVVQVQVDASLERTREGRIALVRVSVNSRRCILQKRLTPNSARKCNQYTESLGVVLDAGIRLDAFEDTHHNC